MISCCCGHVSSCKCIDLIGCEKDYENDFKEIHFCNFRRNDFDFDEYFVYFLLL